MTLSRPSRTRPGWRLPHRCRIWLALFALAIQAALPCCALARLTVDAAANSAICHGAGAPLPSDHAPSPVDDSPSCPCCLAAHGAGPLPSPAALIVPVTTVAVDPPPIADTVAHHGGSGEQVRNRGPPPMGPFQKIY